MHKDMQPRAVRFTPAEREAIRRTAIKNGMTESDVIRAAVAKVTGACPTCGQPRIETEYTKLSKRIKA